MIDCGETRKWYPGLSELDGCTVKIVGIAQSGMSILGLTYVVELPNGKFPTSAYPYTHATAFELHLK